MTHRILCIEDNPQNMRLVRKMLGGAGYIVLEATTGMMGYTMLKEKPDLVLVDVNLPDIDGLELTMRAKADETYAGIPFIALTANAMFGDRERCLQAGCDGYIPKPITKQELLGTIAQHLTARTLQG